MTTWILRLIFGDEEAGTLVTRRFFHRHNMGRNMTVIVVYGPCDAHRLEGAKEVLTGNSHARRYPHKQGELGFRLVEGREG